MRHRRRRRRPGPGRKPSQRRLAAESEESGAFREHLFWEELEELGEGVLTNSMSPDCDRKAVRALCGKLGVVKLGPGEYLLAVEPRRRRIPHMEFDATLCEAGLKRFVRPVMPSDHPGAAGHVPINPRTGNPDPTIKVAAVKLVGNFVVVEELRPGIRARLEVDLPLRRGRTR